MAGLFIGIFVLLASVVLPLEAEEPSVRDLRVTDASGQVTLKTADHSKQAAVVDEETPLAANDIVETGPKSSAELTMDGESVFKLQPGSRLQIKKLYQRNTLFELTEGAIVAKVQPASRPDQGLYLRMPTAVVAVRGTEFAAGTGAGVSHVGVFDEGHVAVGGVWGHEAVKLAPNQETQVTLSNVPQPPRRLAYFKKLKTQMPRLRRRAAFWHKNWRRLSAVRRQAIRDRLADPRSAKSQGFLRPPKPSPVRRAVHARRSHKQKSAARRSRPKQKRPANPISPK